MKKQISAEELERVFDEGEQDILEFFDTDNPRQPNLDTKRVNVDFPVWMVNALDREARRIGVGRQAIIKTWIAERLDEKDRKSA